MEEDLPEGGRYSELWMGTHTSGPSFLADGSASLQQYLEDQHLPGELPYLFKVLSIDKPLSIQAHPDEELAQQLHRDFPDIYKDPHHKPELACALTPFEALCGFRSVPDVFQLLFSFGEELVDLLGGKVALSTLRESGIPESQVLKSLFSTLMRTSNEVAGEKEQAMIQRLARLSQEENSFCKLLSTLDRHFPGDVGVFCAFFLNHIVLQPGEAIFLGPNVPHAYLSGNCIECMACSDNVVRAGLTPKLRDADVLLKMLEYEPKQFPITSGERVDEFCWRFPVPVSEFLLYRVSLPAGYNGLYQLPRPVRSSEMILLSVTGSSRLVAEESNQSELLLPGTVFFVPSESAVKISKDSNEECQLFYCQSNLA